MSEIRRARILGGVCLLMTVATGPVAGAEILHTYVLIESQVGDEDRIRSGLGANLGMCKYVIVGSVATDTIGRYETIVRLDCEGQDALNDLVVHAASGIEGVTKVSVLAVSR